MDCSTPSSPDPADAKHARRRASPTNRRTEGFTLIELLVVIGIVGVLLAILLPSLAGARESARAAVCATRLQQLGIGLALYFNDFDNTLPQLRVEVAPGVSANIGTLFGGKKGTLPVYGIDQFGAERRPLNRYVLNTDPPADADPGAAEVEAFKSPSDKGGDVPGLGPVPSMYDLLGTSYTLNDHTLDGDAFPTLIPPAGGPMPSVVTPAKTWVLGVHPIYNFQEAGDRGQRWYNPRAVEANLLFLDMHVGTRITVPPGIVNTTDRYTFLPDPSKPPVP